MAKSWQNLLNFGGSSQFPWSKKPVLASMPSGTNIVLRGGSRNSLPEHDVCSQAFFSLEGSCKGCCTSQANLSDMVIPAVNMAMVGMVQIFGYHWYYLHCTKKSSKSLDQFWHLAVSVSLQLELQCWRTSLRHLSPVFVIKWWNHQGLESRVSPRILYGWYVFSIVSLPFGYLT